MARKPRDEFESGTYHVFARGNNRQRIFRGLPDYVTYLRLLGRVIEDLGWSCLAYCLMDNHVHLLVETPAPNLGAGIQRAHGRYARMFNARHGHSGHLFQERYGATRIEDDEHLLTSLRYIARNPVEAGLCDEPEQWPWNSCRSVLDGSAASWLDIGRLLGYFAALGGAPRQQYATLLKR